MPKVYDTFVGSVGDLPEHGEVELTVRSLEPGRHKYTSRFVRAVVARERERLPDADVLQIRFLRGGRHDKEFAITIVGELGEYRTASTRVRT